MGILDFLFRRSAPAQTTLPAAVDRFAGLRERRDLRWRQWLQSLEHPFELVPGAQAQTAFEAARTLGRTQGFSPLIVQPGFDTPIRSEPIGLKDSKVRTAEEYFEWRAGEIASETDDLTLFDEVNEVEQITADGLSMIDRLSETRPISLYAEVAILRLPCPESWKIPLFVPVVPPDNSRSEGEEIGIQKQWYERFGAELCCVGDRSWQFRVTQPPRDHDEAVKLLRQHYLYSWLDDAYEPKTIEISAAALRVSTHWMFFWQ